MARPAVDTDNTTRAASRGAGELCVITGDADQNVSVIDGGRTERVRLLLADRVVQGCSPELTTGRGVEGDDKRSAGLGDSEEDPAGVVGRGGVHRVSQDVVP